MRLRRCARQQPIGYGHTGASKDIATRPLKHMADDLGHASMGTTDQVYIQSDMKDRARTGKDERYEFNSF